jgi:Flp pilus assembly pilin Flp
MTNLLCAFAREEDAQDLIEYTLLLSFCCLVAAALFIGGGQSTSGIWVIGNNHLRNASNAAS